MKRRVITTSVCDLDTDEAWKHYRSDLLRAFGPRVGMQIASELEKGNINKLMSTDKARGMKATTVHQVVVIEEEGN